MPEGRIVCCSESASWLIQALGDSALFTFVGKFPAFVSSVFRGFKVEPGNVSKKLVRSRLVSELCRSTELCSALLELDASPWQRWQSALSVLDGEWVARHWRDLLRGPAARPLAAAMAVDGRPPIRRRGLAVLRRSAFWRGDEPAREGGERVASWDALVALVLQVYSAPAAVRSSAKADRARSSKREERLARELGRLRGQLERQRAKTDGAETARAAAVEEMRAQRRQFRQQLKTEQERASYLVAAASGRAEADRAQFRREVLRVTAAHESVAEELRGDRDRSLAERIDVLLDRQRVLNERHGVLSSLREQLQSLQSLQERVHACLLESVVVLPELEEGRDQLGRRIGELEALVTAQQAGTREMPDHAAALLARIRETARHAEQDQELDRLEAALDVPALCETFDSSWVSVLKQAISEQRSVLSALSPQVMATSEPALPVPAEPVVGPREVWDVAGQLAASDPGDSIWLFIDGYNAIRCVGELAECEDREGLPSAREHFQALCRRVASHFARVEIVFDGAEAISVRETVDGMTVVFAAQAGASQNADDYIAARLPSVRHDARQLWLVTDDYGLRERVKGSCAAFVAPLHFHQFARE